MPKKLSRYLGGTRIQPIPIPKNVDVVTLVEKYFQAYNAARLGEACRLFTEKMLNEDVTVGLSITGALTPAGLGGGCIVPLIRAGFVDWIVSTGANLYHDAHFGIGLNLYRGSPFVDDRQLRKEKVVRIYDIIFDFDVLLSTDMFFRKILESPEFDRDMSTSEFHYLCGKYIAGREKILKVKNSSLLATAYRYKVPVYTPSPGDSSIGMNIASQQLLGSRCKPDVSLDVNETAAIVFDAKRTRGKSGVLIFGGGSPKNFMLQTEPQIQEVLGIREKGHDYFIQVTDARPDTGGLSGATPSEAVSWGKVDPARLPDAIVAYTDSTIAMPILTSYALAKHKPRRPKRLYARRGQLVESLRVSYLKTLKQSR